MHLRYFVAVFLLLTACSPDAEVLLNAPPQFDGAEVYIDGRAVGRLESAHTYRHGRFAAGREMGAPPRHEANLYITALASGTHRLKIVKAGHADYHATFTKRSAYVEVFIPDDAVRPSGG